ncbi:hypothetical protein J6590_090998 [Homalodisca vitripennis]|nr:hypothetical protein J6590_090998 [Homalodisca vitripennis]
MSRSKIILELALATNGTEDKAHITDEKCELPVIIVPEEIGNQPSTKTTLQLVGNELLVFDEQKKEINRVQVELMCSFGENEILDSTALEPNPLVNNNYTSEPSDNSCIHEIHPMSPDLKDFLCRRKYNFYKHCMGYYQRIEKNSGRTFPLAKK